LLGRFLPILFIFLFVLLVLPHSTFAQTAVTFSDNFLAPTPQSLTDYNPNYYYLIGDASHESVSSGQLITVGYSAHDSGSYDRIQYQGTNELTDQCSSITGVVTSFGILGSIVRANTYVASGFAEYTVRNEPVNSFSHDLLLTAPPYYQTDLGSNLLSSIDLTLSHTYTTCVSGSQVTFSVDGKVIDGPRDLTGLIPGSGYAGFDIGGFAYLTNFSITGIPPNTPPVVNPLSDAIINEGNPYSTTGSFSDPDSSSWTATVDYGDGSGAQPLILSGTNFTLNHIYTNEGSYTLTVSVTDNQGATGTATATITVNDVPPSVRIITAPSVVKIKSSVSVSALFTYPGIQDMHTAIWAWGDGSHSTGVVTESNGSGSVIGSHAYTTLGAYTIILTVTNQVNQSASSQIIVAVSPSNGFSGANLTGLNYSGANLSGQNLSGANLSKAILNSTNLQNANVSGANLSAASLQQANLTGVNLSGANLTGVNLSGANLTGANLTGVNLSGANLTGANLTGANLSGANLSNSNLSNVNLTGTNLKGANLKSVVITGIIWSNTTCPDNTNSNKDGGTCKGHGGGL